MIVTRLNFVWRKLLFLNKISCVESSQIRYCNYCYISQQLNKDNHSRDLPSPLQYFSATEKNALIKAWLKILSENNLAFISYYDNILTDELVSYFVKLNRTDERESSVDFIPCLTEKLLNNVKCAYKSSLLSTQNVAWKDRRDDKSDTYSYEIVRFFFHTELSTKIYPINIKTLHMKVFNQYTESQIWW